MQQPNVAEVSDRWLPPVRAIKGRKPVPVRDVKVVDLHAPAYRPTRPGARDARGVEYSHPWMVRGRWRQQPTGPRQRDRTPTWVPAYIKGPPGAPLVEKEAVFRWR